MRMLSHLRAEIVPFMLYLPLYTHEDLESNMKMAYCVDEDNILALGGPGKTIDDTGAFIAKIQDHYQIL